MLVNLAYLLQKPTGTTNYALNLLPYLSKLDPYFLATPASGLEQYVPVPTNLTAEYGMQGHMRRLLWTQFKLPAIYQTHRIKNGGRPLLFCPIAEAPIYTRCRFIVMVHDLIPLRFPTLSRSLTWLYRYYVPRVLAAAEHVLCNSQATADDLIQFYGLSSQKITPIPLAHDSAHFRPLDLERQRYFLILGRHAPYKNIAIALRAFANLPDYCDYDLWIAGPPDPRYTPALERLSMDLGVSDRVKFLNYVAYDQLPSLLNQALALVFPSLWEGFGLPVLEAMACGTPVIASTRASIPEVTGDAAILVDPYRSDNLTDAMAEVARSPDVRNQLSQQSKARAAQFSWQRTGEATVHLIQQFL